MLKDNFLQYRPQHAWHWWAIKVLCGIALIAGLFARYVFGGVTMMWNIPVLYAQVFAVAGGLLYCWHYYVLRSQNAEMSEPQTLVEKGGLYSMIRHPMYFSDAVCYTGLALFWLNPLSIALLGLAYLALVKQAQAEDQYIAKRFPQRYADWADRTRLIVPLIY